VLGEEYEYDANGNRTAALGLAMSPVYDDQDRLLAYGTATYTYTASGQLATKTDGGVTTTYDYDALGNLRQVARPGTTIDYVVDGAQRRVGKLVNGTLVQGFLWEDRLRVAAELDGSGAVAARFVYGDQVNVPEYMVTATATYRLLTDHLGSVRIVVDVATGAVVQEREYDEWGRVTVVSDRFVANDLGELQPFGFAGGLYDPLTKLVRFGVRDYDSYTGRWLRKDPERFAAYDSNLYAYARNDPMNFVDPKGGRALSNACIGALAAGLAGAYGGAEVGCWVGCSGACDFWECRRDCLGSPASPLLDSLLSQSDLSRAGWWAARVLCGAEFLDNWLNPEEPPSGPDKEPTDAPIEDEDVPFDRAA